jgi:carboxypeptidase Q
MSKHFFPHYSLAIALVLLLKVAVVSAQEPEKVVRSVFNEALSNNAAWNNLAFLCKNTKGRIDGSLAADKAVEYARQALIKAGADTVWLQQVMVPKWERGYEQCSMISPLLGSEDLSVSALGLSEGTSHNGITAKVIEVHDFEELKALGEKQVEGKIVFFNRPADNKLINSFAGYGGAVSQRTQGPSEASKLGAVAVIVRSATQAVDDFPHTGVTRFEENVHKIPALAVSTIGADKLSNWLRSDPVLNIHLVSECHTYPDARSYNVIGEIRGSAKPDEIITVGGHLDAWDTGEGAHDDGGGCVQAIEMIRLYKVLGIKPKRTVRAVMFMNEEMTGTGGKAYATEARKKGEKHYAALESDRGVTSPRGFSFDTDTSRLTKLQSLSAYFQPFNIRDFDKGGGGSDISPLKSLGALQIGYIPDAQRYFWYHHSANDTLENVNIRELQLGSAAIASLIYLIDLLDL